jgi:hypothetical protein
MRVRPTATAAATAAATTHEIGNSSFKLRYPLLLSSELLLQIFHHRCRLAVQDVPLAAALLHCLRLRCHRALQPKLHLLALRRGALKHVAPV